ncbi:hypothetical protein [Chryseobacterium terrae]|uniref:Uncharacterized protein n=1 Tax=Chryseobacterium terrae TaxID=3163299 RepID=A0ABW8Y7J6_9FLAO
MRKILIILCSFIIFYCNAQIKKINFLIMIDEKPSLIVSNLQIESQSMKTINANYNVGTIDISEDYYSTLISDESPSLNLTFEAILPNRAISSKYLVNIPKLFFNQKYIIINIFNKNSKTFKKRYSKKDQINKEYYVVIETPSSMKFD